MQAKLTYKNDNNLNISVAAPADLLERTHKHVLQDMQKTMKLAGFRSGKAPLNIVEKNADQGRLQADFVDHAINELYRQIVINENIRPVAQPKISVKKFVPFTLLEVEIEVEVIGKMEIADYKKVRVAKKPVKVTDKDVEEVLTSLQDRAAEAVEVKRASKDGDQVVIDFKGTDKKTKEPISGADGQSYPLVIGSNSFIPGFEPELVGLKAGEEKTFDVKFPKDYGAKHLQSKVVTFEVKVQMVNELKKSEINDDLASKVGPFKTVTELKEDIKKQLENEKQQQEDRLYESEVIAKITNDSKVTIPESIIEEQIQRSELEEKQSILYRGQTWDEHLKEEGVTEAEHRERNRAPAENIVKSSLILSEIAEKEGITVTPEELEVRLQLMRGQYQDPQMQAELAKPENISGIRNQMLTEKTFKFLTEIASNKN
jgi:trigger factor